MINFQNVPAFLENTTRLHPNVTQTHRLRAAGVQVKRSGCECALGFRTVGASSVFLYSIFNFN